MTVYIIAPDRVSAGVVRCEHCWDVRAVCIELSKSLEHDPDEHLVLCAPCAYLAGLWICDCMKPVAVTSHRHSGQLFPAFAPDPNQAGSPCGCEHRTVMAKHFST